MKRFRFSLEALLTLRRGQHERAMEAVGLAAQRHLVAQAQWQADHDTLLRHVEYRRSLSHGTGAEQLRLHEWQAILTGRVEARAQEVQVAERILHEEELKLIAARQQLEIIEKVRHRRLAQHRDAGLKEEQKLLDEMGRRLPMARGLLS